MLQRLHIRNYALIDSLDIDFDKGLNLITGETGAGKSIIMGALSLILGQRAENRFFFDPAKKCIIEGYFELKGYDLDLFFQENDLDFEDVSILRRELSPDGKSRAFINDSPVTLQLMKSLGERLIDIHSQHATLQLTNEGFQLQILDFVAKQSDLKNSFQEELKKHKSLVSVLKELQESSRLASAEIDFKQYLFDELATANIGSDEQEILEQELKMLENAEEIKSQLRTVIGVLQEQDVAADGLLREGVQTFQAILKYLPKLEDHATRLQSVYLEVKDIVQDLLVEEEEVNVDQERLQWVQERLGTIYQLQQKHRVDTVKDLLRIQNELEDFIRNQSDSDEKIISLKKEVELQKDVVESLAVELREGRQACIPHVEKEILTTLKLVGMPDSQIKIECQALDFDQFRSDGGDRMQIMFTSNKGQTLQSIGKAASGGELSRLMLSVKSLIASNTALPTIIFDEIDTGISGEVALRVGEVMQKLAEKMQVIAITHLPQIASKTGAHFKVFKTSDLNDRTQTQMRQLSIEERVGEVAEMLSGEDPGEAARAHAKTLLGV